MDHILAHPSHSLCWEEGLQTPRITYTSALDTVMQVSHHSVQTISCSRTLAGATPADLRLWLVSHTRLTIVCVLSFDRGLAVCSLLCRRSIRSSTRSRSCVWPGRRDVLANHSRLLPLDHLIITCMQADTLTQYTCTNLTNTFFVNSHNKLGDTRDSKPCKPVQGRVSCLMGTPLPLQIQCLQSVPPLLGALLRILS